MSEWFLAPWPMIGAVVLVTTAMYASTLLAVRLAGRRTLARLSAFDVVTTIAVGTLLGSTAISRDPSYARGLTALLTLLGLQIAVAAARRWIPGVRRLLDFAPLVVVRHGEVRLPTGLLGPQLTPDELRSALRRHGVFDPAGARVVVLEPNGQISVDRGDGSSDPVGG